MKKYLVMIALCFAYTANVIADNKVDSLKHALNTAKADTSKIKTLNRLSKALWRTGEYDKALDYANQALTAIESLGAGKREGKVPPSGGLGGLQKQQLTLISV